MLKPCKVVKNEFRHFPYIKFDNKIGKFYTIIKTDRLTALSNCNCDIFVSYKLPCRHILKCRSLNNKSMFDQELLPDRWTIDYVKRNHRMFKNFDNSVPTELNYFEKQNHEEVDDLIEVINRLINSASRSDTSYFFHKMDLDYDFINKFQNEETFFVKLFDSIQSSLLKVTSGNVLTVP